MNLTLTPRAITALDPTVRARLARDAAADRALDGFLDLCAHCERCRYDEPICGSCGALRTSGVRLAVAA